MRSASLVQFTIRGLGLFTLVVAVLLTLRLKLPKGSPGMGQLNLTFESWGGRSISWPIAAILMMGVACVIYVLAMLALDLPAKLYRFAFHR